MLELNSEVLYFNAKTPNERTLPRKAWIVGINADGTYDVNVMLLACDPIGHDGLLVRVPRCKFFGEETVKGNRRGDPDKWDWQVTGERFICLKVPTIIPTVIPKRVRDDRDFDDGSGPAKDPEPATAKAAPPTPPAAPVTPAAPASNGRPPVPTPSRTNSTMRLQPKAGATLDH